jgi:hypothetical protein
MDHSYQGRHPPAQLAAMIAQTSSHEDDTWFADSGANHHITSNLEQLTLQQPYNGSDNVAVGNGAGLQIKNTGSLSFRTPHSTLYLNRVFHCPQAFANLLSVNQFCHDNNCFFILTSSHYFIKDSRTGVTILKGRSDGGLYPLRL